MFLKPRSLLQNFLLFSAWKPKCVTTITITKSQFASIFLDMCLSHLLFLLLFDFDVPFFIREGLKNLLTMNME